MGTELRSHITFLRPSLVAACLRGEFPDATTTADDLHSLQQLSMRMLRVPFTSTIDDIGPLRAIAASFFAQLRRDPTAKVVALEDATAVIESDSHQSGSKLKVIRWVGLELLPEGRVRARPTLRYRAHPGHGLTLPGCFDTRTFPNRLQWSQERDQYELPPDGNWEWAAWATKLEDVSTCFRTSGPVHDAVKSFANLCLNRFQASRLVVHPDHLTVVVQRSELGTCLVEMVFATSSSLFRPYLAFVPKASLCGRPLDSAGVLVPLTRLYTWDDCVSWTVRPLADQPDQDG